MNDEPSQSEHDLVKRICRGNKEAEDWMQLHRIYIHEIDDLIDVDFPNADQKRGAQRICEIGAMAFRLYTHPFFVQNSNPLGTAILLCRADYAASVKWEEEEGWKKTCSDWLRHGSIRVVMIVAAICGGYQHMQAVTPELWELAYNLHHDEKGQST